ncbi:hypothetical protein [Novosphingopyxis sp.]|uniref:hypothetical protein n=1 Tax=Novosphingopyxis sp. TaxID=2709690 RepID=UPI003B5CA837
MNREELLAATAEAASAAASVADHLDRLTARIGSRFPLQGSDLREWDDDPRERLHAFLRLFEQLFDLTSRKLFRGVLVLSGETITGMSLQNQFRRVEALGGIESAGRWIELGAARNILVHDYSTDPDAQAARANRAWNDAPDLTAATRSTIAWLGREEYLS